VKATVTLILETRKSFCFWFGTQKQSQNRLSKAVHSRQLNQPDDKKDRNIY